MRFFGVFRDLLSGNGSRRPKSVRVACRALSVEPLEHRTLLSLTISGTVDVFQLPYDWADDPVATGAVPVRGAKIEASYEDGGNPVTLTSFTNPQGDYTFEDPFHNVAPSETIHIDVYAQSGGTPAWYTAYEWTPDEQQIELGANTTGDIILTAFGQSTGDIDISSATLAADIEAALEALPLVDDVNVSGAGPLVVEFLGIHTGQDVPQMTIAQGTTPVDANIADLDVTRFLDRNIFQRSFDLTIPDDHVGSNYTNTEHNLSFDAYPDDAVTDRGFAIFSILQTPYLFATQTLGHQFNEALTITYP